jgi:ArsR family metal-binding transcriptional regulator
MSKVIGTFPRRSEFDKAKAALERLGLPHEVVSPEPAYGRVGAPALLLEDQTRSALFGQASDGFTCSGWVDYRPAAFQAPNEPPPAFAEDIFGQAGIMVLGPCTADANRIRLIAHISGNLTDVFPYLNSVMPQASYNPEAPTLTYMDRHRLISLYPSRIAVAKADEIVDAWRVLEGVRRRANDAWARRGQIAPSYQRRAKPPALEIYNRLPKTNCRECGEKTCMAFALRLWTGDVSSGQCRPIFQGEYRHLQPAFLQICAGLGVAPTDKEKDGAQ